MPDKAKMMNPQVAALEKAWWDDWWAQDFSWEGLAQKIATGSMTLQDFWDAEKDFLISEPESNRQWTRFHCPFVFANGTPSPKATWIREEWDRVATIPSAVIVYMDGVVLE